MSKETEDISGTVAGKLEFILMPVSVPLFWYLWERMDILALSSNIKLIFPDH